VELAALQGRTRRCVYAVEDSWADQPPNNSGSEQLAHHDLKVEEARVKQSQLARQGELLGHV